MPRKIELDDRERDAIAAALLCWQRVRSGLLVDPNMIMDLATQEREGGDAALTLPELRRLRKRVRRSAKSH